MYRITSQILKKKTLQKLSDFALKLNVHSSQKL